eukprot:1981935-Rhodomonas_salina.1
MFVPSKYVILIQLDKVLVPQRYYEVPEQDNVGADLVLTCIELSPILPSPRYTASWYTHKPRQYRTCRTASVGT